MSDVNKIDYCDACGFPKEICRCSIPNDFVVFGYEQKLIFRFMRHGPDNWNKMSRDEGVWKFEGKVGDSAAKHAFQNLYDQVFVKQK